MSTGFRIADKDYHRNYVLISKEQHWRSPGKKLEKENTTKLQPAGRKNPEVQKNLNVFRILEYML